jgi:hypothetical protein
MTTITPKVPGLIALDPATYPTATASGADDFVANPGFKYLIHVIATGSPVNMTLDDPTSQQPAGASAFNPDVLNAIPVATPGRFVYIANPLRFINAQGKIQINWGAGTATFQVLELQ